MSEEERFNLKNNLTQSIVSFIKTKSSQSLSYIKDGSEFDEREVFNSFAESSSSAIIFNPLYAFCKESTENEDLYKVIVYVDKNSFNELTIAFFKSTILRLKNKLNSHLSYYKFNPTYTFESEIKELKDGLTTLSSYYGLMVSLSIEQSFLEDFFKLEYETNDFSNKINSLENNLKNADILIQNSDFLNAFDLLNSIKLKYPNSADLKRIRSRYNESISLAKIKALKDFKNKSTSFDNLSIGFGFNTALINNYKGSSGLEDFNSNSFLDRIYPYFEVRYLNNDRDHIYGFGPYYRYHFSNTLFVLSSNEYYSPFSKPFSEAGINAQYFYLKNQLLESKSAFTLSVGKLLESFVTERGNNLNFWTFSIGSKTYLQNSNLKSYRTSLYLNFNLVSAGSEFSYSNFTIGISRDFKVGRKIQAEDKKFLEENYKILK